MRLVSLVLASILALSVPVLCGDAPAVGGVDAERRLVMRVYYDDVSQIRALVEFDLWEFNDFDEKYVLVAIAEDELEALRSLGFETALDLERTEEFNTRPVALEGQTTGIPGFPCYRTVEETHALGAQMAFDRPDLASWIDVGDSWEKINGFGGHDLYVLKLTNSAVPGPKPTLLVTTSVHPRELAPVGVNTEFALHLFDNYGVDADATWLLDHHEIHLLLLVNPDGRKQAENGFSWRKNTNQDYCGATSNGRGVDLNRNFEYEWGCCGGASNSPCNELYRGPAPASDPETQFVQDYMRQIFPDQRLDSVNAGAPADATGIYIDIHSAASLVLWPWGFPGPTGNDAAFTTFGRKLAYFNSYLPKQAAEFYPTDGTTMDFAYGDLGVAAIAYELSGSFFQNCADYANVILPSNLPSLIYAAKVARTPYLTPSGPEALSVTPSSPTVESGTPLVVTATVNDTRFNNQNGAEPVQNIATAELYLDVPPWVEGSTPVAMTAVDGAFDAPVEQVSGVVDTGGLVPGRHIVFVRGVDAAGNRGPLSATFFHFTSELGTLTGVVSDQATSAALPATVSSELVGASGAADAVSGAYAILLPVGTWTVAASAAGHSTVEHEVTIVAGGTRVQDFELPAGPSILVVDDDNDTPDVAGSYTAALDALGEDYAVWDTGGGDAEPGAAVLAPYETVLWFTGSAAGPPTGPGPASEINLGRWLDGSGCLLVAGQDYHGIRGKTAFMESHLGLLDATDDVGQLSVTGLGSAFGGLGPYSLTFPYANRTDRLIPSAAAKAAFVGSSGDAALTLDTTAFRTSYWGFGLEGLPTPQARRDALGAFFDWCEPLPTLDGDGDGTSNAGDCAAADPATWSAPSPARNLTLDASSATLSWDAPQAPGGNATRYDLLRASSPQGFALGTCVGSDLAPTSADDSDTPPPGETWFYLVRAGNGCGATLGVDSSRVPRVAASCR
ncbi:MAG: hypothetical protein GY716_20600 [bacterium]|nr:hypothetical protein [bacterium]